MHLSAAEPEQAPLEHLFQLRRLHLTLSTPARHGGPAPVFESRPCLCFKVLPSCAAESPQRLQQLEHALCLPGCAQGC